MLTTFVIMMTIVIIDENLQSLLKKNKFCFFFVLFTQFEIILLAFNDENIWIS